MNLTCLGIYYMEDPSTFFFIFLVLGKCDKV